MLMADTASANRGETRTDMNKLLGATLAVTTLLTAGCAGLVALVPAVTGSSASAVAATATSILASPAVPVAAGASVAAVSSTENQSPDHTMVGMSRANAETCAGFHNRVSEVRPDGIELWTYQRNACRVSIAFKEGYVTDVSYSEGSSDCASVLR